MCFCPDVVLGFNGLWPHAPRGMEIDVSITGNFQVLEFGGGK